MSEMTDESEALTQLHARQRKLKDSCFSYLSTLDAATPAQLKAYGYIGISTAEAMRAAFQSYVKQLSKLIQDHVRNFPDK